MRTVPVGHRFALVDEEHYDRVSAFSWSAHRSARDERPQTWLGVAPDGKQVLVSMHILLFGAAIDGMWDHINRDPYDNRRENLRIVTRSQNNANRGRYRNNSSGAKGVSRHGSGWRAFINRDGKRWNLGTYRSLDDAIAARAKATAEIHGQFAGAP